MGRCSREDSTHKGIFYKRTSAQVCIYGELTDSFETRTGVRQVHPFLSNIHLCGKLDKGHRFSELKRCPINPKHRITDLEYADAVLFADSYNEMQIMLNNVSETAARIGLRVSMYTKRKFFRHVFKKLYKKIKCLFL
ncbi:unnamed protein product [Dracunculus medinensis]|uniref:Reverse transcriptase domain-containing protein n=1 Tax=Dracunculus medinensis TaxID=318479 RepID=A0A0N4UD95_DRAME|nr:unnamed protein product [Dracunculus medinensis]